MLNEYQPGERVKHPEYGIGVVKEIKRINPYAITTTKKDIQYCVIFSANNKAIKARKGGKTKLWLLASLANLKRAYSKPVACESVELDDIKDDIEPEPIDLNASFVKFKRVQSDRKDELDLAFIGR
jgi:hypothetical protein